jgi:succinoglycan biosynthesis transport protein ExoP
MAGAHTGSSDTHNENALQLADFGRLLRTHVSWWVVPAVVCAIIASVYSLVTPREWKATQALVVRPEVASVSENRLGKFADLSEMKTLQETVLELAKSQNVIQAALREVGPPSGYRHADAWPTALDVEAFRDHVDMRPPGGAEFGKTEVFYLSVSDNNRDRSSALLIALCGQLQHRMQELRDQSAHGMISELERTVAMANEDLAAQTNKLSTFEGRIGADLGELRSLNADAGSQSGAAQEITGIEAERRANEAAQNEHERLLTVLTAAKDDSAQLLATPNSLLVSQPALSQLKNALISAQLRTSELLGSRSENHPFVVAARESEGMIRNQLNNEISVAIRGLQVEVQLCGDREKALVARKATARDRVSLLAESRAEYTNLVASVQNHSRLVEAAEKNLADARARSAAAHCASVISRIDGVEAGIRPAGPARKTVAAAGGVGGLLVGFGLVFLFASPSVVPVAPSVAAPKRNTVNTVANGCHVAGSAGDGFGMFRGLSLQEAVQAVQRRCR